MFAAHFLGPVPSSFLLLTGVVKASALSALASLSVLILFISGLNAPFCSRLLLAPVGSSSWYNDGEEVETIHAGKALHRVQLTLKSGACFQSFVFYLDICLPAEGIFYSRRSPFCLPTPKPAAVH